MDKGYYQSDDIVTVLNKLSQSTIKMDKGYYRETTVTEYTVAEMSQSTIKMDKGYYSNTGSIEDNGLRVAIHNKNGQGLLHHTEKRCWCIVGSRNPQ